MDMYDILVQRAKYAVSMRLAPLLNANNGNGPPALKTAFFSAPYMYSVLPPRYIRLRLYTESCAVRISQDVTQSSDKIYTYTVIMQELLLAFG